jgi:catechol 2,3-dioxygenase-like lactoylglutathione lyase family enzyme
VRFYADVLGLDVLDPATWPERAEYACLQTDQGSLVVLVPVAEPRPLWPGACAYFEMTPESWREVQARLRQHDVEEVLDPKGGLRGTGELRVRVRDPDG